MFINKLTKFFNIIRDRYFRKILLSFGVAASTEHEKLFNFLQNAHFNSIVDIGANRGQFSLIARKYFPTAKIIAFEPLWEPASAYRKIFALDPLVVFYELAIGSKEDQMTIHVSNRDDSSSLLPISNLQSSLFSGTGEKETRTTLVKPLSDVIDEKNTESPALLKIDVQGFEREVLEGCKSLLPWFTYVYVECSFVELYQGQSLADEIISNLREEKFALTGVYNLCYDKNGSAIQADFLFRRIS